MYKCIAFLYFVFLYSRPVLSSVSERSAAENVNNTSFKDHPAWKYIDDPDEECGESNADRIIGGTDASLGQYPWIARLGYTSGTRTKEKTSFQCGGVLINPIYVITAGHCITNTLSVVRLGEHDTYSYIDCSNDVCADPIQDIKPQKIILHEEYDNPHFSHDIALIRLEHKVDYNGWVSPICLPREIPEKEVEGIVEVAGWGFISLKTRNFASILQTIKIPIIPNEECKNQLKSSMIITKSQICAGGQRDRDSCGGDSGGPMMKVDTPNGFPQYFLYGIVSYGPTQCGNKAPGIYTNIPYYMKWILDHLEPTV